MNLERFCELVSREGIFRQGGTLGTALRLRRYLERLFASIDLTGKRVLDIGAGTGVFSLYISFAGAASVYAIEPEQAGSQKKMVERFARLIREFRLENIVLESKRVEELPSEVGSFDLLLLHNCINHFDERACTRLHEDDEAREVYLKIFAGLSKVTKPGGLVLMADCSRHNFFNAVGLKSPVAPSIDWKIHQTPKIWTEIAEKAGFEFIALRWTGLSHLGDWSRPLLENRMAAYFLLSHFSLVMRKGAAAQPRLLNPQIMRGLA